MGKTTYQTTAIGGPIERRGGRWGERGLSPDFTGDKMYCDNHNLVTRHGDTPTFFLIFRELDPQIMWQSRALPGAALQTESFPCITPNAVRP